MTDLAAAIRERDAGMAQALGHAAREHIGWGDLAYAFLQRYARSHASFIAADVVAAGREWGMIQPPNDKAWGHVFLRAAKLGIITRAGYVASKRRHCSPTPLWHSNVWKGEA